MRYGLSSTLALCGLLAWAPGLAHAGGEMTPRDIYKNLGRAVVLVFATDGSAQGSAGTGSIITPDGQIITNCHVISKEGKAYKKVFIYLKPDKLTGSMQDDLKERFEAQIVEMDTELDLALLKMKAPPAGLPTIPFADPEKVEIGDPVVAIGHPETGGLWTMTTGIVSSVVKDFQGTHGKDVFQTEASINRGNSGGPLLNQWGQMVGINTSISRRAADGLAITSINFSLKSSVPVEWMKKKDLMSLAYANPGTPAVAVAMADPPKKPAETKTYEVKGDEGSKAVVAVEPEEGQEVANVSWQEAKSTNNVSGSMTIKGPKGEKKPAAPAAPPEPKMLTKSRPYKLDPFVEARVKEIKALEKDMDNMRDEIDKHRGKNTKRPSGAENGNGLW
ncbi:MAG: serine protease [Myxococcota bacterium]